MTDTKASDLRAERLKTALRDNLRRRKAQLRERGGRAAPAGDAERSDPSPVDDPKGGRA